MWGPDDPEVFYPQINTILPHKLFLGNTEAGESETTLRAHGITDVLNLRMFGDSIDFAGIKLHRHRLIDGPGNTLAKFSAAIQCLESLMKDPNTCIFVHCMAGVSRSPTVIATWWAETSSPPIKLDEALDIIKKFRPAVNPNYFMRKIARAYLREIDHDPAEGG